MEIEVDDGWFSLNGERQEFSDYTREMEVLSDILARCIPPDVVVFAEGYAAMAVAYDSKLHNLPRRFQMVVSDNQQNNVYTEFEIYPSRFPDMYEQSAHRLRGFSRNATITSSYIAACMRLNSDVVSQEKISGKMAVLTQHVFEVVYRGSAELMIDGTRGEWKDWEVYRPMALILNFLLRHWDVVVL